MCLSLFFTTLSCLALGHAGQYKDISDPWSFDVGVGTYADWMGLLVDNILLSHLVIPGTRNSMTDRVENGLLQTQNAPLSEQLLGGIRYIDISCQCINNHMVVYNGAVDTGYSLDDVLTTLYDFLDQHSHETIILSIQKGGILSNSKTFLGCIERYFVPGTELGDRAAQYIYSRNADDTAIPFLGQVRGKVLVLEDFKSSSPGRYGIPWGSRSVSSYNHRLAPGSFFLNLKWAGVKANLDRAPSRHTKLRITHTPASIGVRPIDIAAKDSSRFAMNRRLGEYIVYGRASYHGVIVMDFPGKALIHHMVWRNDRFLVSEDEDEYFHQLRQTISDEFDHNGVDGGEGPPVESSDDEGGDNEPGEDELTPTMVI